MPSALPPQPLITASQLGQWLIVSRKHRKLTQSDVAQRIGLSQNRVSHLEKNPEEISFRQLLNWCAVIGLQLRLGERDVPEAQNVSEW